MPAASSPQLDRIRRPAFLPSYGVRIAAGIMPGSDARDRYRHEYVAELYGMPWGQQQLHAVRILLCAWRLRRAITTSAHQRVAEEAAMTMNMTEVRMPLRCRFNLHHTWVYRWTEDGTRYRTCSRCGKDDHRQNGPADGAWIAGA